MNEVLKDFINQICLVYMDDVVIFSVTLEDHLRYLRKIFKRLKEFNLKIQTNKCEFLKKEAEFLGHIITPEGIKPNPTKIDAILKFPIPKTHKQIKSFLGMIGFYRKFINNLAKISKPLTLCLKKGRKVIHDEEFVKPFELCKIILCNESILSRLDFSKTFTVVTDASKFALGAVLTQNQKPICYASRTLNPAEINYSTTEKELLAIVWAVRYFRPYLFGRHFKIKTDHKPLKWLANLKEPNSKLVRWKLLLSEYDFEIDYIKGKDNVVADALSRNPKNEEELNPLDRTSIINEPGDINETIAEFIQNEVHLNTSTIHSSDEIPILSFPYSEQAVNNFKHQMIIKITENSKALRVINEKVFENNRYYINLRRNQLEDDLIEFVALLTPNLTYHVHFPQKDDEKIFMTHMQDFLIRLTSNIIICPIKLNDVASENERRDKITYHHIYKTGHRGINTTLESLK